MMSIMDNDKFLAWLDDIDPRMFYRSTILDEMVEFGFVVKPDDGDKTKYDISIGDDSHVIYGNTWQDDFDALVYRGLPFFVIDEAHIGEPEYHEAKSNKAGYAVVNPADVNMDQLAMIGSGYIFKNERSVNEITIVGSAIVRALARLIAKKSPGDDFHGRGSAARANLKAIREALGCYNGANEV